jgi:thioester reductase-like protein
MHLVTGFPGFLASAFVPRLLARSEGEVACLVQPHWMAQARERVAEMERTNPDARRIRLVEGDLTRTLLGLNASLIGRIESIYHFAAVYDLGVGEEVARRVNVEGTRNVLDVARASARFGRLHYVSTLFVSGRYAGAFSEADLSVGQRFNNHYERSKYRAEVAVREAMQGGLAATVYRPAIVVGDSRDGSTQKLDGPYYFVRWLLRWSRLGVAPVPTPMRPDRYHLALAPRDYVLDALDALSARADTSGQTFHLVDPHPPTIADVLDLLSDATGVRAIGVPLSPRVVRWALGVLPGVRRLVGIEPETFAYLTHPTQYVSLATQRALASSGVACPPLARYVGEMVRFARQNPHLTSAAMA